MLWLDRLRVVLRSLGYREAWGFGPRWSLQMLEYLWHTRPTWRAGEAELNVYSPPVGGPAYPRYLQGLRRAERGDWVPLVAHVSVTDRCPYGCHRCSNLGKSDRDPSLESLAGLVAELRRCGACRVALTGGEPLLRDDLEEIVRTCGSELSPVLFTSGHRLDLARARQLKAAGLDAAFVSLDHDRADEHDRVRGQAGAWHQATEAIRACRQAGLYTAAQAVVRPSILEDGCLERFLAFCRQLGVHEVMLLEEVPIREDQHDPGAEMAVRRALIAAQLRSTRNAAMPKVSSMSWLESPECLGCQAGFSFLYVSANGEVFPCDFVPLSFGNVHDLGLPAIHERMQALLRHPSSACLARKLRNACGVLHHGPLAWEATRAMLRDYDPGPPPKRFRSICHGHQEC